jgi:ATP-dependent DNA helicase RecQ
LRKRLADERSVPPYVIFSDVSLRQMARSYPASSAEFSRISGVGEKKLEEFGPLFLAEIATFLSTHSRQSFAPASLPAAKARPARITPTVQESLTLFRAGHAVDEIAERRGMVADTIYGHLATAVAAGEKIASTVFFKDTAGPEIENALARFGTDNLTGIVEALQNRYSYGQLRLFLALRDRG